MSKTPGNIQCGGGIIKIVVNLCFTRGQHFNVFKKCVDTDCASNIPHTKKFHLILRITTHLVWRPYWFDIFMANLKCSFTRSSAPRSLTPFPCPCPCPCWLLILRIIHPEKSETPKKKVESSHVPPCPNLVHTKQEPTRIQQLQCTCQERSLLWQCQWVCYEGGDSSKHNWNYIDFSSVEPPVWSCQWAPASLTATPASGARVGDNYSTPRIPGAAFQPRSERKDRNLTVTVLSAAKYQLECLFTVALQISCTT